MLEQLVGTRYVVPLREGGSLPAVVEAAPGGTFVVKFRGAGQGAKALVAEALAAGLAGPLGLPIPRAAIIAIGAGFGEAEPDPEIQDILRGSAGENFGLAYLPGAISYDPATDGERVAPDLAADIVWFDALITNVDRTARNTNLLLWQDRPWLIDHGASLYFHHRWQGWRDRIQTPFAPIKDHVLLPLASDLTAADARLRPLLTEEVIAAAVATIPDAWLGGEAEFADVAAHRAAYVDYLLARLNGPRAWLQEAIDARRRGPEQLAVRLTHRPAHLTRPPRRLV
jgi:hypothetical protein